MLPCANALLSFTPRAEAAQASGCMPACRLQVELGRRCHCLPATGGPVPTSHVTAPRASLPDHCQRLPRNQHRHGEQHGGGCRRLEVRVARLALVPDAAVRLVAGISADSPVTVANAAHDLSRYDPGPQSLT